jgi:hypothetical protein
MKRQISFSLCLLATSAVICLTAWEGKSQAPQEIATNLITPANADAVSAKANSQAKLIHVPTDSAHQITSTGIGVAKLGMSLKELKKRMGSGFEFPVQTNFMVDSDAIAITKAGKVQFYIPYEVGSKFTDTSRIEYLITENPEYRTKQGVGPGTRIRLAAKVYGRALLSYNDQNESREYIDFKQQPPGLTFRPAAVGSFVGEYPKNSQGIHKTQKYDARATIGRVEVFRDPK